MKDYRIFDILGPTMIGPSSSHTAGAARLGKVAKEIARPGFEKITFHLHGSFAKTYRGHGTDRALVAGALGMEPDDEDLIESLQIAKDRGLTMIFKEADLGYVHPNTVKMVFEYKDRDDYYIIGSSIGGGNIIISDINGAEIEFTGKYPTVLIKYKDSKGAISRISSIVSNADINIGNMKVTRDDNIATMIIEVDSNFEDKTIEEMKELPNIINIMSISTQGGA